MYEGVVYRPPSEARSLILQVTIGCSHNKCSFCSMYKGKKFRIKSIEKIEEDIKSVKRQYAHVKRIFLADGDALIMSKEKLLKIIGILKGTFKKCERISCYASPKSIALKSDAELKELREAGLKMLYMGVESGNDEILGEINKGCCAEELIRCGKRVREAGFKLSVTAISGLGGEKRWKEHAVDTAGVINEIRPEYFGLLTLMIEDGTDLKKKHKEGKFKLLTPAAVMKETYLMLEKLELENTVFRSNHASNYVPLGGTLGEDKEELLGIIREILKSEYDYNKETYRSL